MWQFLGNRHWVPFPDEQILQEYSLFHYIKPAVLYTNILHLEHSKSYRNFCFVNCFLLDNHIMTSTKERSKFLISKVKRALKDSSKNKHTHYCRQAGEWGQMRDSQHPSSLTEPNAMPVHILKADSEHQVG